MDKDTCLACGSKYIKFRLKGFLECESCHFTKADINISESEIIKIYSKDYFQGKEYRNYLANKKVIQMNLISMLNVLLSHTDNAKSKKLFEIGCASGFFLELARNKFKSVAGIDISYDAVTYAKETLGLDSVYAGNFLDYEISDKYDVFCMYNCIEHLKEPRLAIEKISSHINKGGVLAITTPDIGSFYAKFRSSQWRKLEPPAHLYYFNLKALSILLQRYGFKVIYVGRPGAYIILGNILYGFLVKKYKLPKVYSTLLNSLKYVRILDLIIYLNLFDCIYMIGKKQNY